MSSAVSKFPSPSRSTNAITLHVHVPFYAAAAAAGRERIKFLIKIKIKIKSEMASQSLLQIVSECSALQLQQRSQIAALKKRCSDLTTQLLAASAPLAAPAALPSSQQLVKRRARVASSRTVTVLVVLSVALCVASSLVVAAAYAPAVWITTGVVITLTVEAAIGPQSLVVATDETRDGSDGAPPKRLGAADEQRWQRMLSELEVGGGGEALAVQDGGAETERRRAVQAVCDRADALELANKPLAALRIVLAALGSDFSVSDAAAESAPPPAAVLSLDPALLAAATPADVRLLVSIGRGI